MIKATFIAAALAITLTSEAQIPATPPSPPSPPIPAVPPVPSPDVWRDNPNPPDWSMDFHFDFPDVDIAPMEFPPMPDMPDFPEMPDLADFPDLSRLGALDELRMDLMDRIDFDFDRHFDFDFDRFMPDMDFDLAPMAPMAPMEPLGPMTIPPVPPMAMVPVTPMLMEPLIAIAPTVSSRATAAAADLVDRLRASIAQVGGQSPFERQFGGIAHDPPKAWAQSDPADSLYRLARETLNHGEYRRAAQLFSDITQRYPNSAYAADARYWRAFALYRIGGQAELRDALRALQQDGRRYYQASLQTDAAVLAARIRGALAIQGDPQAAALVSQTASTPGEACDREDLAVRVEALNSLGQTDPESATPILRRVLARRDDCSATLRRAALYLLGRRKDNEAATLIMSAARNDADLRVRGDALRFLAGMPGDQAISTIEEIARTPGNDELQRAAVAALGKSDSPRARQSLRAIIERSDLSEGLRGAALAAIDADHTPDNGAYIRSIYPRLETPRLKGSAIRAIARIGGNDNDQWLLSVVRNAAEPVDVRTLALRYAGRSTISIGDLVRMYDSAGDRPLREALISLYSQRTEPEATDKLIDIARKGTDPDMRRMAISSLSRKNDPRTKQLLLEIIDK